MYEFWLYLFIAASLVAYRVFWELIRYKGTVTPLAIFIIFYFYFTFGPVIAHWIGIPIYSGINVQYLALSCFIFTLALSGLCLTPSNSLSKLSFRFEVYIPYKSTLIMSRYFSLLLWLSTCIVLFVAISRIGIQPLDKVERIKAVGSLHYPLMTLWPIIAFCYMAVTEKINKNFMLCFILYCFYCLYIGERDFILIVLSIAIWWMKRKRISIFKFGLIVLVATIYFVFSSLGRGGLFEGGSVAALLNQGSNLMVTSNVASWLEQGMNHWNGRSYFSSIINMFTLGAIKIDEPLSIWFSSKYSSSVNDGAFGFAMEAEAYLNFGLTGVFLFFAIISMLLSKFYRNHKKGRVLGSLLTYFSIFYLVYAIRGEALMIFKAFIYCMIIFFTCLLIAQRGKLNIRS